MKHIVLVLVVVAGALSCNPTARCRASSDCGPGVCSGGFCTDVSAELMTPDGGHGGAGDAGEPRPPDDADEGDGGAEHDAGVRDFDAGDNGRP